MQFPFSFSDYRSRTGPEFGIAGLVFLPRIILQVNREVPVETTPLGKLPFLSKQGNQAGPIHFFPRCHFLSDCFEKCGIKIQSGDRFRAGGPRLHHAGPADGQGHTDPALEIRSLSCPPGVLFGKFADSSIVGRKNNHGIFCQSQLVQCSQ